MPTAHAITPDQPFDEADRVREEPPRGFGLPARMLFAALDPMVEELLDQRRFRRSFIRGRLLPQAMAFVYYQISWLLYVVRLRWSYALNADSEHHALHTYLDYVDDHPELDNTPWISEFRDDYAPWSNLAELFTSIALDERSHRAESTAQIRAARFGEPARDRHRTSVNDEVDERATA